MQYQHQQTVHLFRNGQRAKDDIECTAALRAEQGGMNKSERTWEGCIPHSHPLGPLLAHCLCSQGINLKLLAIHCNSMQTYDSGSA